jgi:hypothetical protein
VDQRSVNCLLVAARSVTPARFRLHQKRQVAGRRQGQRAHNISALRYPDTSWLRPDSAGRRSAWGRLSGSVSRFRDATPSLRASSRSVSFKHMLSRSDAGALCHWPLSRRSEPCGTVQKYGIGRASGRVDVRPSDPRRGREVISPRSSCHLMDGSAAELETTDPSSGTKRIGPS